METFSKDDEGNGWKPQVEQTNAEDDEGWRDGYGSIVLRHVSRA